MAYPVVAPARSSSRPADAGPAAAPLRFGPFELDPVTRELSHDGTRVPLLPQAFRVLTYLVLQAPRLVLREEVKALLWPERPYGNRDNALNVCVRYIRVALGDDRERPRFLATHRGVGYRFLVPPDPMAPERASALEVPLVDALPDVVLVADGGGRTTYASRVAARAWGYEPEELVGQSVFDVVEEEDRQCAVLTFTDSLLAPSRAVDRRLRLRSRTGASIVHDVRFDNRIDDPAIAGVVMVFRTQVAD
jgi:PAS domain S-box-containing protein